MTLGELTETADVSVRTVRYYIAEGLLPPPEGSGPGSAYRSGHLHRLRLIQRMKRAYLPLKEIRRRLSGLDDDEVRELLRDDESQRPIIAGEGATYDASLAGARKYLSMLESREQYRTEPMALSIPQPPGQATAPPLAAKFDAAPQPARSRGPRASGVFPARPDPDAVGSESETSQLGSGALWHRIPLGDEAELVISDRVYGRHRDRIDWLVRWARKVFG
jgi:DNA-binding transcriptional MerR regulator